MNETPRQKRRRLRWLTLAEFVAIVAVLISGLGLWQGWKADPAPPPVAALGEKPIPLTLRATVENDRSAVVLAAVEAGHALQSVEIVFPAALAVRSSDQSGEIRLSASTFDDQLFEARDKAKLAKLTKSEARLPLLIVTRYIESGSPREGRALYDLGYTIRDGGIFGGREIRIGGLSLVTRGKGATQIALDRRWTAQAR